MKRSTKRYVEKLEAMDFAMGTYNARTLRRERYNQRDFLEYLNNEDEMSNDRSNLYRLNWAEEG